MYVFISQNRRKANEHSTEKCSSLDIAVDADELANCNINFHRSRLKRVPERNVKLDNNYSRKIPLFALHVIIVNKAVWRSLELSPVSPVSDFSYRVVFECLSPGTVLFTSCRKSSSFWSELQVKVIFLVYYMACSESGQDEPNSTL